MDAGELSTDEDEEMFEAAYARARRMDAGEWSTDEDSDDGEPGITDLPTAVLQHILQTGGGRGIPNLVKHASACAAVCRGWRQIVLLDGSDLRLAFGADLFGGERRSEAQRVYRHELLVEISVRLDQANANDFHSLDFTAMSGRLPSGPWPQWLVELRQAQPSLQPRQLRAGR